MFTRRHRENAALAFSEHAEENAFFAVDYTFDSAETFTIFRVAKDILFHASDYPIAADIAGHMNVEKGDFVIDSVAPHKCLLEVYWRYNLYPYQCSGGGAYQVNLCI